MARILVFGAGGRLGAALARDYAVDHDVTAWGRQVADLSEPDRVAEMVRKEAPEVVINCAAMTNVDACEQERHRARLVNADAAGAIARAASEVGARLLHISTDYVFSGDKTEPYSEEDAPGPISWYGETKLAGEKAVMDADTNHAVIRVSWVFGPDRDSFVDKAVQTAMRGEPVKAVADKWSSPSSTKDIGQALRVLFLPENPGGIYHACNSGVCTWRDWAAEAIAAAHRLGLLPNDVPVEPLRLSDISMMIARRPVHTSMTCRRIEALLGHSLRPWQEAVADYVGTRYGPAR